LGITSKELVDTFINFNHTLVECSNCHRRRGGSSISLIGSSCLAILLNSSNPEEHGLEAVSRFQLYLGRLKKEEKQWKLIDWIWYAEADITGVNKMPYFLPFIVDGELLEKATETYSYLVTHMNFQSTMMDLLGIGCNFF
jgi:hypothetical protein